jgi:hypothetical protein
MGLTILAGNQLAIDDRINAPVLDLGKGGTEPHHFVLDKEGHHLCQFYLIFLAMVKPVTVLPSTRSLPSRVLTWCSEPVEWQTTVKFVAVGGADRQGPP